MIREKLTPIGFVKSSRSYMDHLSTLEFIWRLPVPLMKYFYFVLRDRYFLK